ncbi:uncharacterized protein LOC130719160 [Lotus japonicus]|uniref:uncharacterized protein LOC130719160 n=1 Tax=Lotus japonicus TaxID=34305 RepID=UPI00258CDAF6|nr:uncharacterized protein LOC130719160 [Lotus japonicus]
MEQVSLKLLVNEKKNRVLFVEAGKDFVDVLLSFLTLPLGTIARLVRNDESNVKNVTVGSLSSLYESVAKLDEKQFWTATCKEMLLRPRNSMERYCKNLKLNINDDTEKTKYFICENRDCNGPDGCCLLSTFKNQRCKCGKLMKQEVFPQDEKNADADHKKVVDDKGFVLDTVFIISDDLNVMPDSLLVSNSLPTDLGCEDFNEMKLVTVHVTEKEVLDLLKCSLFSPTPFTDIFLTGCKEKPNTREAKREDVLVLKKQEEFMKSDYDFILFDFDLKLGRENPIQIKVMLRKSDNTILFALCENDFVDFLLSFLTFPLGGVVYMLDGKCCLGSIDNLYMSVLDLYRYLRSFDLRDQLLKSQLAYQFKLRNQILPIDEAPALDYTFVSKYDHNGKLLSGYLTASNDVSINQKSCVALRYLAPQSSIGGAYSDRYGGRGLVKKLSRYMVTDELAVTPCSSTSIISFLSKLRIPSSDLEERVISIGKEEGLSLLRASLVSSSALTNGLGPFLGPMIVKKEKWSH